MKITQLILLDRMLLIGAPGIGKTERIKQLAEEEAKNMGRIFVDVRRLTDEKKKEIIQNPEKYYLYMRVVATHIFPEDIQFPIKKDEEKISYIRFFPPEIVALFTLPNIAGLIFLDEITNVTREDQLAMYFSFVLEKELGWDIKLSEKVKIVSAGNPPEYSYIVNPPPYAFLSRFWKINVDPPSLEEWYNYMEKYYYGKWDKRTYLYLKIFPQDFLGTPEQLKSFENFPCPRSWTEVAVKLNEIMEKAEDDIVVIEYIKGKLGNEVGGKFVSFLNKGIIDAEEVLENPLIFSHIRDPEKKYLTLWGIAQNPEKLLKKGRQFIQYLSVSERDLLIILLLLVEKKERRKEILKHYIEEFTPVIKEVSKYIKL